MKWMSQGSQVSWVTLWQLMACSKISGSVGKWVSQSVSQWQCHLLNCPQTLDWTDHTFPPFFTPSIRKLILLGANKVSAEWIRTLGPSVGDFLYICICWRRCYWVFSMSANLVYLIFPTTRTQNTSGQYVFLSWKYHPKAELAGYFIIWQFSRRKIQCSLLYISQGLGGLRIYAELSSPLSIFW